MLKNVLRGVRAGAREGLELIHIFVSSGALNENAKRVIGKYFIGCRKITKLYRGNL